MERFISKARLRNYNICCHGNTQQVLTFYAHNLLLSQSFYPLLSIFEVALRNSLNETLTAHFKNDGNWLLTQRNGFMIDERLGPINKKSTFITPVRESVNRLSYNRVTKKRQPVNNGMIVADLPFAFWTELFNTNAYKILEGSVIHAFPNKPKHANRTEIYKRLTDIRKFRNRIYHNEPICFAPSKDRFSLAYSAKIHTELYELTTWISDELSGYMSGLDTTSHRLESFTAEIDKLKR